MGCVLDESGSVPNGVEGGMGMGAGGDDSESVCCGGEDGAGVDCERV